MSLFHKVRGKLFQYKTVLNSLYAKAYFRLNGVRYGTGLTVKGKIFVDNGGTVVIGDHCRFNSAMWANPTTHADQTAFRVFNGGILKIGNHCGISNVNITCTKEITIEDHVMIGAGCCIWDTDFHPINYESRISGENGPSKAITIKEGTFIGANVIIMKGVRIGKHSVIGAGSVVTKDVPDYEVVAGNPVKPIRKV